MLKFYSCLDVHDYYMYLRHFAKLVFFFFFFPTYLTQNYLGHLCAALQRTPGTSQYQSSLELF